MSIAIETRDEINSITGKLIELGICDDQKYAVMRDIAANYREVTFDRSSDLSAVLKNQPYPLVYQEIKKNRDYNVSLLDGALIQLQYEFLCERVVRHRLAFFPSPELDDYQNDPELYEENPIYAEIVGRHIVATPLRFDFAKDDYEEDVHPMSHCTIGQYKNCRIPVASAVSPFRFFEFILGSFYNTAYRDFRADLPTKRIFHPSTIAASEQQRVHFNLVVED